MKKRLLCFALSAALLAGSCLTVSAAPQKMADGTEFDAVYYAEQNPDVVAALGKDAKALYSHYVKYGKAEGRKAVAGGADDFDAAFYAKEYPDVANALGTDAAALYQHYINFGKAEGRKPNAGGQPAATSSASGFDAAFYAKTYPDVANALGTDATVLYQHYVNFGKAEGRKPNASGQPVSAPAAAAPTAPAAAAPTAPATAAAPSATPSKPVAVPVQAPYAVLTDKSTIQLADRFASLPASDDGTLYVYELAVFEYAIPAGRTPIASIPLTKDPVVTFAYTGARLYEKFAYATKQNGKLTIAGSPQFISNPELLAPRNVSRTAEMKGMQGPTHAYAFQNYEIKGRSNNGHPLNFMSKTVALINRGTDPTITHPLARAGYNVGDPRPVDEAFSCYMLNANDQAGVDALIDEMTWVANGTADVFIVGNEVNVRKWNYIKWTDDNTWNYYVRQYAQAFRIIYNAIKSQNAGAQILTCIDQNWDRNNPKNNKEYFYYIDAKDFLNMFNNEIQSAGNIDWGVTLHPHPVPLTNAKFWAPTNPVYKSVIQKDQMVSFQNLGVVTKYIRQPQFAKRDGQARYIIIGELGLTNAQGGDVQGAAIAAAFQAAKRANIPQVILSPEGEHGRPDLNYTLSGRALEVYNAMGTANESAYMDWAKGVIGISDWSQILR